MESGSKDLCFDSAGKKNNEKTKKNKDVAFIGPQKMRTLHFSERIEEMVCELGGYRWNAILLSETWRHDRSEIWKTPQTRFHGAGKYDIKHGVGIMLNKKWRQIIINTEYINGRAITATTVVNRQLIKLLSGYFHHWGNADHHIVKMYRTIERSTLQIAKDTYLLLEGTSMQNWDLVTDRMQKCWQIHPQRRKQKK